MQIKTKHKIWFYALAGLSTIVNAYNAYHHGNTDAAIAWIIAGGGFFGTAGAYYELKQLEDANNPEDN